MLGEKYPTSRQCKHLEVVHVNPEIFTSEQKDIKTDGMMLQQGQKPLCKGIIAVAKRLADLVDASEAKDKAFLEK